MWDLRAPPCQVPPQRGVARGVARTRGDHVSRNDRLEGVGDDRDGEEGVDCHARGELQRRLRSEVRVRAETTDRRRRCEPLREEGVSQSKAIKEAIRSSLGNGKSTAVSESTDSVPLGGSARGWARGTGARLKVGGGPVGRDEESDAVLSRTRGFTPDSARFQVRHLVLLDRARRQGCQAVSDANVRLPGIAGYSRAPSS